MICRQPWICIPFLAVWSPCATLVLNQGKPSEFWGACLFPTIDCDLGHATGSMPSWMEERCLMMGVFDGDHRADGA